MKNYGVDSSDEDVNGNIKMGIVIKFKGFKELKIFCRLFKNYSILDL